MKAYIFMNERIHQRKPDGPVIRVQVGKRSWEGNHVEIRGTCVVRYSDAGLKACKTHHVKAWLEADARDVTVTT